MKNMAKELAELQRMGPVQLRAKHLEVFGQPTRTGNKAYLVKRIGWRLQMLAEGDLSQRAQRRAAELANDADIRMTVPKSPPPLLRASGTVVAGRLPGSTAVPMPGTVLARNYKGKTVQVTVLADGFDHEGTVYKSLSAVAQAVTGCHWNGHLFFGLRNGGKP